MWKLWESMGKIWEKYGKNMGIYGKNMGNYGKNMGHGGFNGQFIKDRYGKYMELILENIGTSTKQTYAWRLI
jgi:hypothetical protein